VLGVLGWLPTRACALAIAAMGRSELAFAEWRAVRGAQRAELRQAPIGAPALDLRGRDEHLLAQVAEAALRVRPDDEDQGLHLAWSMVALAERAWLATIATLVALGALVWIA
jgi:membrane protein required for beta-lactamase induction